MEHSRRITITLVGDQLDHIERFSKEAGMTLSQYSILCLTIGLKTMRRITEPEKVYTPEQQIALMVAAGYDREELDTMILERSPAVINDKMTA